MLRHQRAEGPLLFDRAAEPRDRHARGPVGRGQHNVEEDRHVKVVHGPQREVDPEAHRGQQYDVREARTRSVQFLIFFSEGRLTSDCVMMWRLGRAQDIYNILSKAQCTCAIF